MGWWCHILNANKIRARVLFDYFFHNAHTKPTSHRKQIVLLCWLVFSTNDQMGASNKIMLRPALKTTHAMSTASTIDTCCANLVDEWGNGIVFNMCFHSNSSWLTSMQKWWLIYCHVKTIELSWLLQYEFSYQQVCSMHKANEINYCRWVRTPTSNLGSAITNCDSKLMWLTHMLLSQAVCWTLEFWCCICNSWSKEM